MVKIQFLKKLGLMFLNMLNVNIIDLKMLKLERINSVTRNKKKKMGISRYVARLNFRHVEHDFITCPPLRPHIKRKLKFFLIIL